MYLDNCDEFYCVFVVIVIIVYVRHGENTLFYSKLLVTIIVMFNQSYKECYVSC